MTTDQPPRRIDLDLGDGHTLRFYGWSPDRDLNPQYDDIADEEKSGAIVSHIRADGSYCEGAVTFDTPAMRRLMPERAKWTVESWEPLTLSPSLLCKGPVYNAEGHVIGKCGDHGFIRCGRWVRA